MIYRSAKFFVSDDRQGPCMLRIAVKPLSEHHADGRIFSLARLIAIDEKEVFTPFLSVHSDTGNVASRNRMNMNTFHS